MNFDLVADLYNYIEDQRKSDYEQQEYVLFSSQDTLRSKIESDMRLYQEEYIYCKNYIITSLPLNYVSIASEVIEIYFRIFNDMVNSYNVSSENKKLICNKIRSETKRAKEYIYLAEKSYGNIFTLASEYGILPDELLEYEDTIIDLSRNYDDIIIVKSIADVIEETEPNHIINKLKLKVYDSINKRSECKTDKRSAERTSRIELGC